MVYAMLKFKKFLVPTDFSGCSRNALEYGISLAGKCSAKIFLLHVIDVNQFPPDLVLHHLSLEPEKMEKALEAEAENSMKKLITRIKRARIPFTSMVRSGNPYSEIVSFAGEAKIDLIIMGTHGRTGIVHALLGSTAEKVVRQAPCPVLTVKKD